MPPRSQLPVVKSLRLPSGYGARRGVIAPPPHPWGCARACGTGFAASEGDSVRGSPCGGPARLRFTSLRPPPAAAPPDPPATCAPNGRRYASGGTSLAIRHGFPASSSERAPRSLPRPSATRHRPPSSPLPGMRGLRRFRACGCSLREAPLRMRLPCGRHAPGRVQPYSRTRGQVPCLRGMTQRGVPRSGLWSEVRLAASGTAASGRRSRA
jgi:hypothetical protein